MRQSREERRLDFEWPAEQSTRRGRGKKKEAAGGSLSWWLSAVLRPGD